MDIKVKKGTFSLRAAAIIIENNCLLLAKSDKYDCFYTVGGGIQQNETSDNAVLRECYEETGYHFEIDRLVFIQERFYMMNNVQHHEVFFFYLLKKMDCDIHSGVNTDQNNEYLHWIHLEELETINITPAFLRTALKSIQDEITHILSYE